MSFDTEKSELGRQPVTICEMDLGFCFKVYNSSSTNLLKHSEDFTNAVWVKAGAGTVTEDQQDVRNGTDAQLLSGDEWSQTVTVADDGLSRTLSIFLKEGSAPTTDIKIAYSGGTGISTTITITWGFVPTVSGGNITAPNDFPYGFHRVDVTLANNSSGNTSAICTVDQTTGNVTAFGGMLSTTTGHYVKTEGTAGITTSCDAALSAGSECFNTRDTCQDDPNFDSRIRTYRFSQYFPNIPIGIPMFPAIEGQVSRAPTTTTAGKGLGNRGVVSVGIGDFTHHDRDIDPYVSTRPFTPEEQGTFWGKFIARNPFWEQRELRVLSGYVKSPWDWDNFETEVYDITNITGPNNARVNIQGKDILTRTYNKRNQYPVASTGELLAGITDVETSATLTPTGIGNSEYSASGYLAIGKEICSFTRAGDALTLTREQWGTTAKPHDAEDTVQECRAWEGVNVVDVLEELLSTGASIQDDFIPYDNGATGIDKNWDIEKGLWLASASLTGILMKPEPIDKVISELSSLFLFDIWWDAVSSEVRIKALSPEASGVSINTLNDDTGLIADSIKISRDSKSRVSRALVWYDKLDFSEKDSPDQFGKGFLAIDSSAEGPDRFGRIAQKTIMSRWFDAIGRANQLASRTIARFTKTPILIDFTIDLKDQDKLSMAERIQIDTHLLQDETGANLPTNFQITKITEGRQGQTQNVKATESSFFGRYGFVAPDGTADYGDATEDEKDSFAWISPAAGADFGDGGKPYKII